MSAAVSMPQNRNYSPEQEHSHSHDENDWLRIGAGVTLIAGSLLLLTKQRRLGLLVTVAGTALAALEHREVVAEFWETMPHHLEKAHHMITQAEETLRDLSDKRDKIMSLLGKS